MKESCVKFPCKYDLDVMSLEYFYQLKIRANDGYKIP